MSSSTDFLLLGQVVGRGSYASVYALRTADGTTTKLVAKVASQHFDRSIQHEATILKILAQTTIDYAPHDIDVLNVSTPYLVMQRYDQSLSSLGKIPLKNAAFYLRQTILILQKLHNMGITHRDISLDNLMLDNENNLHLIDFGNAENIGSTDGRVTKYIAPPSYISPEMLTREPHGFESDWWMLGVSFFKLVTGHFPFSTALEITEKTPILELVDTEQAELLTNYKNLIEKLLTKNPKHRMNLLAGKNPLSEDETTLEELFTFVLNSPLFTDLDKPDCEIFREEDDFPDYR